MKFHAVSHAIVETQIAQGYGPSKRAIARLQSEGLSRHEALHAIAAVNFQFAGELLQGQTEEQRASFQSRKNQATDALHATRLGGDKVRDTQTEREGTDNHERE